MNSGQNRNSVNAYRSTFYSLTDKTKIKIPDYQREYAQGRDDSMAEHIRVHFIGDLLNSLKDNEPIELNFIYGGADSDGSLVLIDGQQRITTLFLLHWYIFIQTEKDENISSHLNNFVYAARKTTERFCKCLVNIKKDELTFNQPNLSVSSQITDKWWFTGAMLHDATVKSMLMVLDEIQKQFIELEQYDDQLSIFSKRCQDEHCPITFLILNLEDTLGSEDSIHDLYMKMNSRGKYLTDFEVFKSRLQKKQIDPNKFDLLHRYFEFKEEEDTNENRKLLIGRFNTEYANGFFKAVDDGIISDSDNKFDIAMMNAIKMFIRIGLIKLANSKSDSFNGTTKLIANNLNELVTNMSGNELISFIEEPVSVIKNKCGKNIKIKNEVMLRTQLENSFFESFKETVTVFDKLNSITKNSQSNGFNLQTSDPYYHIDEKMIFSDFSNYDRKDFGMFQHTVRSYALFKLWMSNVFSMDDENYRNDTYKTWSHFIYVTTYQTDNEELYKAIDDLYNFLRFFDCIFEEAEKQQSVENAIEGINIDDDYVPNKIRRRIEEEQLKLALCKSDCEWRDLIPKAEKVFASNRIMYLFKLSFIADKQYSKETFKRQTELAKLLFYHQDDRDRLEYQLANAFDNNIFDFERAMLCLASDDINDNHLIVKDSERIQFLDGGFERLLIHNEHNDLNDCSKNNYALTLLKTHLCDCSDVSDVLTKINEIIDKSRQLTLERSWKKPFIDGYCKPYDSIDNFKFKKTIELRKEGGGCYVILYSTNDRKSKNVELRTFALAKELRNVGLDFSYNVAEYNDAIFDVNGKPIRYLKIIYDGIEFYTAYLIKDQDCESGFYLRRQTSQQYDDFLDTTIDGAVKKLVSALKNSNI